MRKRVRAWCLDQYTRTDGKKTHIPATRPAAKHLDEIKVPTLVLIGDVDEKATQIMGEAAASGIPGAQKVVLHNVAHMIPLEVPDEFNRMVMSFLP